MKYFVFVFVLFLSLNCNAVGVNYKEYYNRVDVEITNIKNDIKTIKKSLKSDKNNVELHKYLVLKQTTLKELIDKKNKIREAEKKYNELVKQNEILDKIKTKLLHIKSQSDELDKNVRRMFR